MMSLALDKRRQNVPGRRIMILRTVTLTFAFSIRCKGYMVMHLSRKFNDPSSYEMYIQNVFCSFLFLGISLKNKTIKKTFAVYRELLMQQQQQQRLCCRLKIINSDISPCHFHCITVSSCSPPPQAHHMWLYQWCLTCSVLLSSELQTLRLKTHFSLPAIA